LKSKSDGLNPNTIIKMHNYPEIALIGVSGFGEVHYTNFLQCHREDRLRIVAVTVINHEQQEEKCRVLESIGCRVFSNTDEMFAAISGQCDLCVIPTGIHLHATMTTAVLAAGCNVLVEKPAAATIQEVFSMQEAKRKSDRFVAVGFQKLYAPETLTIKQAILDGFIGRVTSIRCRGLWPRPQSYYTPSRALPGSGDRELRHCVLPHHHRKWTASELFLFPRVRGLRRSLDPHHRRKREKPSQPTITGRFRP